MVRAWFMDDARKDGKEEHQKTPPEPVDMAQVKEMTGVMYWNLNPESYETDGILEKIKEERGYTYDIIVEGSEEELPLREQFLRTFFSRHQRTHEEIRFMIKGSGYYDVRADPEADWIRIEMGEGDLIVLPAKVYRRFAFDKADYAKVLRLYIGEPKWPLSHIPMGGDESVDNAEEDDEGDAAVQASAPSFDAAAAANKHSARTNSNSSASSANAGAAMGKIRNKVQEREDVLNKLEESSEQLEASASNFASASHKLMLKYRDKKWYQF